MEEISYNAHETAMAEWPRFSKRKSKQEPHLHVTQV